MKRVAAATSWGLGAAVLATFVGCGGQSPESRLAELNDTNLKRVANLYLAYQMEHEFRGPQDEQTLIQFAKGISPTKLERIGVDPSAIEQVMVSQRDGQTFKVRYGVKGSMMGSQEPVVFEAEGKDGKRMVGFLDMSQREVDASEYDRLWANGVASSESPRA